LPFYRFSINTDQITLILHKLTTNNSRPIITGKEWRLHCAMRYWHPSRQHDFSRFYISSVQSACRLIIYMHIIYTIICTCWFMMQAMQLTKRHAVQSEKQR